MKRKSSFLYLPVAAILISNLIFTLPSNAQSISVEPSLPPSESETANISENIDYFKFNITILILGVFLVIVALQLRTIKELNSVKRTCGGEREKR